MVKPLLIYAGLRFGLFVVLLAGCWAVGLDQVLGVFVAVLLSVPLSYFLLRGPREALNRAVQARAAGSVQGQAHGQQDPDQ